MSISLKNQRRKFRRRSYAKYKPPKGNNGGPRNDPFRILFYLILIAGGVWIYLHQDEVRAELFAPLDGTEVAEEGAAEEEASTATTTTPGDASATDIELQADQAYQEGHLMEAVELYRQASEASPEDVNNYVQVARLLIYQAAVSPPDQSDELLAQALEAANTAVLVDPFDPAGYAVLGKVYDWQGRPDQASSTLLQAIDIDKDYALAHSYMAEAQIDLGRWEQAGTSIDQALALAGDNVDVRRDYGYILEMQGDYAGAMTQYEAAVQLHPRLAYLRLVLARVSRQLGNNEQALNQLFEAQTSDPTNALLAYELGRTYESFVGDAETALEYYQRAVELDENYGSPYLRIGALLYFQGSYEGAIDAFEHAIALDTEQPHMYYQLGLSYVNLGRCDEATPYLEQAQATAEGDEAILAAVTAGFETCSLPTLSPDELTQTQTPEPETTDGVSTTATP